MIFTYIGKRYIIDSYMSLIKSEVITDRTITHAVRKKGGLCFMAGLFFKLCQPSSTIEE